MKRFIIFLITLALALANVGAEEQLTETDNALDGKEVSWSFIHTVNKFKKSNPLQTRENNKKRFYFIHSFVQPARLLLSPTLFIKFRSIRI